MTRKIQFTEKQKSQLWMAGMTLGQGEVRFMLDKICPKWVDAETPRNGPLRKWYLETECEKDCKICKKRKEPHNGKSR